MAYVTETGILGPGVRAFLSRFAIPEAEISALTEQVVQSGASPRDVAQAWVDANKVQLLAWAVP